MAFLIVYYKMAKRRKRKAEIKSAKTANIKKIEYDVGKLSFVLGLILAIIVGVLLGLSNAKLSVGVGIAYSIIFVMGLIVGILNITVKEVNEFLIAVIAFLVAAGINVYVIKLTLERFGGLIDQVFNAIAVFVAPAALVVALKAMFDMAKKR